jgi:hypothetical protein
MYMIGHHHKCIQFNLKEMVGEIIPMLLCNSAQPVEIHFAIYMSKKVLALVCANRDEICARFE